MKASRSLAASCLQRERSSSALRQSLTGLRRVDAPKADACERVAIDDAGLTDEFIGEYIRHRREDRRHGDLQHDQDRAAADSVCYHQSKTPPARELLTTGPERYFPCSDWRNPVGSRRSHFRKIRSRAETKTGCNPDHVLHPKRDDNVGIGGNDQTTGVDHARHIRFALPRILPCPARRNAEAAFAFG